MNNKRTELKVSAIRNGTVIDHIPSNVVYQVFGILNLNKISSQVYMGTNLDSEKLGKKGIIKLSEVFFKDDDINKIALVAPSAKLNIIRNFEVVEKKVVEVPDEIVGIVKCVNPKCITNNQPVTTRFYVISKDIIRLKCHYCEKITNQQNIEII